jgi:hypothetical protein
MDDIRPEVQALRALGRLPVEARAGIEEVEAFERAIGGVAPPLSNAEAVTLLQVLGLTDDGCFGLNDTLTHLIETAPGSAVPVEPAATAGYWVRRLWDRQRRAREPASGG